MSATTLSRQALPKSPTARAVEQFFSNKLAVIGVIIVIALMIFSFIGPFIYHTEQISTNLMKADLKPGEDGHPLGTDGLGYDVLGRLMIAGRTSILVGLAAGVLATILGTLWGSVAGYLGGWVDATMMRVVDAGIAIPGIFLLLVISAIVRPSEWMMVLIIGVVSWLVPARLTRAEALSLKSRDYVLAIKATGGSNSRAILRHIIPNTIGTVVVNATFQVADAILLVAYVSFLGMGLQPPSTDWGAMLTDGISSVYSGAWWLIFPAGIAIVLIVSAFNFIGDGLRDMFDVKGQS
ncbi:peptide ABC transporter permease [Arthrobacter alpinus]|uniref:Peptide ABC transporter permease n=1 Tax=Arthrobacter alpinus TaxID=656366 RepID=A0A0M3UFL8_9MICC|nr:MULTISPECIES: ABC transporter permease [Arthrobacter]ALE91229.1 peptide ABC transporter permease [Arthrobacter alpinus]